jgi:ABC-type Fe3+ transport system permease subunit
MAAVAVLIPLGVFFFDSLFRFEASALSSIFFWLLTKSVLFGVLQATLSATFAIAAAFVVALAVLSLGGKTRAIGETALKNLGQVYFVIPGTALSLLLLCLPDAAIEHLQGWPLIVAAHVLWSALFVASHVYERLRDWLASEGTELLLAAKTLGAPARHRLQDVVFPLLRDEIRVWFPLIFLWSFGAFSTVLLLGAGPQHSTPEVLLYYTLFNDVDSSRLLVVFVVTLAIQVLLLKRSLAQSTTRDEARLVVGVDARQEQAQDEILEIPAPFLLRGFAFLFVVAAALFIMIQIFFIFSQGLPDPLLFKGLLNSWTYAFFTCVLSFFMLLGVSSASSSVRRLLVYGLAFSPVLLVTSWSHLSFLSVLQESRLPALLLSSFGLALLQIPFSSLWIERSLSSMNPDLETYARTAGLGSSQVFWKLRLPYLRPSFEKILVFVFCIALGEIALASMWLREWPLLSLLSKKLAQSYDFSAASWIFVLTVLSALVARFLVSRILRKLLR